MGISSPRHSHGYCVLFEYFLIFNVNFAKKNACAEVLALWYNYAPVMSIKVSAILLSIGVAAVAFANSVGDARISFSTKGPDRYADGSVVMDGECYALVWSSDGKFDGFAANGACIDTYDRVVLMAPVAKDGRCPPVLFQIPQAEAEELAGGQYAVYLLDTRVASGDAVRPYGTVNGKLALMNGYGAASANLAVGALNAKSAETGKGSSGLVASSVSAAPADCEQPRIKSMRIEGDNVFLTVENLKGFMRVRSGVDLTASDSATAAVETSGEGGEVTLVTRKPESPSGFFKVIRNGD